MIECQIVFVRRETLTHNCATGLVFSVLSSFHEIEQSLIPPSILTSCYAPSRTLDVRWRNDLVLGAYNMYCTPDAHPPFVIEPIP
jgi:hypothetical protein